MIETREFVQLGNEDFQSFVSAAGIRVDKDFVAFFEDEIRNKKKYHLLVDLSEDC